MNLRKNKLRRKGNIQIMKFTKMHGCGNDYVYVNLFEETIADAPKLAQAVSDRHFGIGSDGLITIGPSEIADFRMRIYNADGSEAEMCGNGIRCVAKYVYDHKLTEKTLITVESGAGVKELTLFVEDGKVTKVRVDMGEPILAAEEIPVVCGQSPVVGEPITVGDKEWKMTCVSMGNPHAVVFVDHVADFPLEKYGPLFENHPRFPKRTNTEFVELISRSECSMRVWERGSAETWACGTGTCATVMACILNGVTDNKVLVHLRGGDLTIEYDPASNHIFMTGPATEVFSGTYEE
jgi:diaminopimelate epimerase